jgi:HD-GYP domain-containing protein (c-di-GMP phosphodiesterase class II)
VERVQPAGTVGERAIRDGASGPMKLIPSDHPALLAALDGAVAEYSLATAEHADRVRQIAQLIGDRLELSEEERDALPWAALLHDLGKIGVSQAVLAKDGPLTPGEWVEMMKHPAVGSDILLAISGRLSMIASGIRAHHEYWDGSGYPDGLAGESIPVLGRIVAVADVFDAMTCERPYREGVYSHAETLEYIVNGSGTLFAPDIVSVTVALADEGRLDDLSAQVAEERR